MFRVSNLLKLFKFRTDRDNHNSLHVFPPESSIQKQFNHKLEQILEEETQNKSKAVWLYLNQENSKYLGLAYEKGFKIHHGKETNLVLYKWLLTTHTDLVPKYSRFYIACGGIVINDGHLLMVQQSNVDNLLSQGNRKDDWGIPGGLAEMNESIQSATQRQVLEQTNLKVNFKYMVYFRELHNTFFDGTDYYYANYVQLDKSSLPNFKLCERQLNAHKWVDLSRAGQFINTHQVRNTQKHLLTYLSQLYQSGRSQLIQDSILKNQCLINSEILILKLGKGPKCSNNIDQLISRIMEQNDNDLYPVIQFNMD